MLGRRGTRGGIASQRRASRAASPYARFAYEEMILRDHLAMDRTTLANERTFLSYTRTAIAFGAGGVSAIHFIGGMPSDLVGMGFIATGVATFGLGVWRYVSYKARIDAISRSQTYLEAEAARRAPGED